MSYQVLARKWRPLTFENVVGQGHVSQTLLNALKSGRLPHAILLAGPRGVGKTSTARILAKSLRCPNAKNYIPCNSCDICEEIGTGSSIDVIEVDGASNNGVDAIRELRETVGYMPSSGKYKVYIIDEVHMLSTSAFNALLKTVEEPPEHIKFIFATTEPQKIPPTILSRCQRFDLRRISTRNIGEHLKKICAEEKVKIEDEALWLIARQAEGSMRDSQSLLDQIITFSEGKVTQKKVIEVLGLTDRTLLIETLDALTQRDTSKIMEIIKKLFEAGIDAKIFMQDLLEEIRNLLIVGMQTQKSEEILDLPDSEVEHLKAISEKLSVEDIHLLFDMALKGGQDLIRSESAQIILEMVLLRMAVAPRIKNLAQLLGQGASSVEWASQSPSTKDTSPMNPSPKMANEIPVEANLNSSIDQSWHQFVGKIKALQPALAAKLDRTSAIKLDKEVLYLGVSKSNEFLLSQLNEPKTIKKLETLIKTYWKQNYHVNFQVSEGGVLSPHEVRVQKDNNKKKEIKDKVLENPLVQETQKIFKSKIKSIKETQ